MLKIWLDGLVLLVEVSEIGYDIFHNVGVGKWIDFRFGLCVSGDATCMKR